VTQPVRLGISPCPNDTFAFHALLAGEVRPEGLALSIELADVEELNRRMLADELDASKVSFHAALAMAERVRVLPCGAALGHGVGPVVLAPPPGRARARSGPPLVLHPGRWTTATLLWRLFHPAETRLEPCLFSAILPRLLDGGADLGVCIHEARFTHAAHGLPLVEDLGATWERSTGRPLPLGGLVAAERLGPRTIARLSAAVRASIEWGLAHRDACLPTMRRHAQEHADDVLWKHVELYVNDETRGLGPAGRAALDELARAASERGLVPAGTALRLA